MRNEEKKSLQNHDVKKNFGVATGDQDDFTSTFIIFFLLLYYFAIFNRHVREITKRKFSQLTHELNKYLCVATAVQFLFYSTFRETYFITVKFGNWYRAFKIIVRDYE